MERARIKQQQVLRRNRILMEALEGRRLLSTVIPVTDVRDLVFDDARNQLLIVSGNGLVHRWSVGTNALLAPLNVGVSPNGADITPDGSTLLVTERASSGGVNVLHKVNLSTGVVSDLTFPSTDGEDGTWDVTVAANGKAFVTSTGDQFPKPLRQLDLGTNTFTTRPDAWGRAIEGKLHPDTQALRSVNRGLLLFVMNGRQFTYDSNTDTFPNFMDTGDRVNALAAVSRTNEFVAIDTAMRGANLATSPSYGLGATVGGVTFDPVRDLVHFVRPENDAVYVFTTAGGHLRHAIPVPEDLPTGSAFSVGTMTASGDGKWLFLATPTGVRQIGIADAPKAEAGGPYTVVEGGSVTLRGGAETSNSANVAAYQWDFNYDGSTFDIDATSSNATFAAAGLDGPSQRTIALRVVGADGSTNIDTAVVNVTNVSPVFSTSSYGPWEADSGYPFTVSLNDLAPETVSAIVVNWGDGNVENGTVEANNSARFRHAYASPGQYVITVTATDEDGTYTTTRNVTIRPKSLDPAFGNGGRVVTDVGPGSEYAQDMVVLPDGKFLVAGNTLNNQGTMEVVRYNANGSIDTSFGTAGKVAYSVSSAHLEAMHVYPDGKILLAGWRWYPASSGGERFFLMRLRANGSIDSPFGSSGIVETDFGPDGDRAYSVAVAPDGKIVLLGDSFNAATGKYVPILARYQSSGALDSGFGSQGKVRLAIGPQGYGYAQGLLVQSDGKILVGGSVDQTDGTIAAMVARLNSSNGSLDTTFGGGAGYVVRDLTNQNEFIQALAFHPDGTIVAAGVAYSTNAVFKFNADGTPTPSFGSAGLAPGVAIFDLYPNGPANHLLVQPDGKIVVSAVHAAVARLNANGTLDTSFGNGGVSLPDFPPSLSTHISDLAQQSNGRILVTGLISRPTNETAWGIAGIIGNRAPVAQANGPYAVAEGANVMLQSTGTSDPDEAGNALYEWDFNYDGVTFTPDANGLSAQFSATGVDGPSTRTVALRVTDTWDAVSNIATATLTITNTAPTLGITGNATIPAGATYTLNLSESDPGLDTISSWTIDWGDGSPPQVVGGNPSSATHVFTGGRHVRTITATATDEDGTYAAPNSVVVQVQGPNAAPSVSDSDLVLSSATIDERGSVTLTASFTDPDTADAHTATIDWGDGSAPTVVNLEAGVFTFSRTHPYIDDNPAGTPQDTYTIVVTVTDGDANDSATTPVTVRNVPPVVEPILDRSGKEGTELVLSPQSVFDGVDALTFAWVVTDSSGAVVAQANQFNLAFTPADDGVYTATFTVTDDDGGVRSDSALIYVTNVRPTLTISGTGQVPEGIAINFPLNATDPGNDTVTRWTIDWGDGTPVTVFDGGDQVLATHTFADGPRTHALKIYATDEDGTYQLPGPPTPGGQYDTTFNGGGYRVFDFSPNNDSANDVLTLPDGKVLVVGDNEGDWHVARFNPDGSPDATFGTNGRVVVDLGGTSGERAFAAALQPDGKFLIVGTSYNNESVLARLNADGSLDGTFGVGGKVKLQLAPSGAEALQDVIVLPDGKILAAGWGYRGATNTDMTLLRFGADGTLDASFGDGGKAFYDGGAGAEDVAESLLVLPTGRILLGGRSGSKGVIAAFEGDGTPDGAFGVNGVATLTIFPTSAIKELALNIDGRIIAAGSTEHIAFSNSDFQVSRWDPDGTFWGGTSVNVSTTDQLHALAIQPGGEIVLAGTTSASGRPATLVRFNYDLTRDTAFGTRTLAGLFSDSVVRAVSLLPDGRMIVAGDTGFDLFVARLRMYDLPSVTVVNRPPTLTVAGPDSADASQPYVLNLSATDVGTDTITSWAINWGDGSAVQTVTGPGPHMISHNYAVGTFSIAVTATDEDGTHNASPKPVTISPVAPVLSDGVLTVTGTVGADTITLEQSGPASFHLIVTVNGTAYTFDYGDVQRIDVRALGGNDIVRLGRVPTGTIDLGDGADSLFTGHNGQNALAGPVTVVGGAGGDLVDLASGSGSALHFDGGDGVDFFDRVSLRGSAGDDDIILTPGAITGAGTTFTYAGLEQVVVHANAGNDTLLMDVGNANPPPLYVLNGNDGNDAFTLASGPFGTPQPGSSGLSTTIDGGNGDDTLTVPAGAFARAFYYGGNGNDSLFFHSGPDADTITVNFSTVGDQFSQISYSSNSVLENVTVDAHAGNDIFNVSNVSLAKGLLTLKGGSGADTFNGVIGSTVTLVEGGDGDDTINYDGGRQLATQPTNVTVAGGQGNDVLNVNSGFFIFDDDARLRSDSLTVNANANSRINYKSTQHIAGLRIGSGARVTLLPGGDKTIFCADFTIAPSGVLELNDGDLVVQTTPENATALLLKVQNWIKTARNGGAWNGPEGIFSASAKNDVSGLTGLSVVSRAAATDPGNGPPAAAGDGTIDVIVKYTWNGDADANGVITADDYYRIDRGFLTRKTLYPDGDFNFNGVIDLDDYSVIDAAYLGQSGVI